MINEEQERELREALEAHYRAAREELDAVRKVREFLSELVRLHGAEDVAAWLHTRSPYQPADEPLTYPFFDYVCRRLPWSFAKGALLRQLCDAADADSKGEQRSRAI